MKIYQILKITALGVLFLAVVFFVFFFIGQPPESEKRPSWGINFSSKHAVLLGLDSKEAYLAVLDDLKARKIKLILHWDEIEKSRNHYNFEEIDWQIEEAEKRGAEILLVMGMKTPRWPECHLPGWAWNLSKKEQQEEVLELLREVVNRYQEKEIIWAWQVENEPLFDFGECPWSDKDFLEKEIELVRSLDNKSRPVLVSDSGEWSFWFEAANLGDIVGTTLYRKVWMSNNNRYINYPFPPVFYHRRAWLIDKILKKPVICVELQAEPWGPVLLYDLPLEEHEKTMSLERLKNVIAFARATGMSQFYLWGTEWHYFMKTEQNRPEFWEEAKALFLENQPKSR